MKELIEELYLESIKTHMFPYEFSERLMSILGIQEEEVVKKDEPVLIGHLNKVFGYNGFVKSEIGTEVFEHRDRYLFYITPEKGGVPVTMRFYKEDLKPCINFK